MGELVGNGASSLLTSSHSNLSKTAFSTATAVSISPSIYTSRNSCAIRLISSAERHPLLHPAKRLTRPTITDTMASGNVQEVLPPVLDSTSEPPPLFDGTTRLYTSFICPYAQRVWITRNYKGLQDEIKLVPLDLGNRPSWYKEKVYPGNKVPALEHNNEVKGESLDLIKYIDANFEGPSLLPDDPTKREFAEELFAYTDKFSGGVFGSLKGDGDMDAPFDHLESALQKFSDGPFFLGQFSLVDVAYAPFVERFQPLLLDVRKYNITAGRPNLALWIEELNKIEPYKQTKWDPKELVTILKNKFGIN